jgi:hypothetical protein
MGASVRGSCSGSMNMSMGMPAIIGDPSRIAQTG